PPLASRRGRAPVFERPHPGSAPVDPRLHRGGTLGLEPRGARRRSIPPVVKIYTRKGDDGTTGLWYGGRVPKHGGRPEAYGSGDEGAPAPGVPPARGGGRGGRH